MTAAVGRTDSHRASRVDGDDVLRVSSLVYLNNRHHDPPLGVFISVDPLVVKTGQPYIYGAANPVMFSDPLGLEPCRGGMDARCAAHNAATGSGWQFDAPTVLWSAWSNLRSSVDNCSRYGCQAASKNSVAASIVAMTSSDFDDARDLDGRYDSNLSDEDFQAVLAGRGREYSPLQAWAADWLLESGGWNGYFESAWEQVGNAFGDIATFVSIGGLVICTAATSGACGFVAAGIVGGSGAAQLIIGTAEGNTDLQVSGGVNLAMGGLGAGTQYGGSWLARWGGSAADRSRVAAFLAVDDLTATLAQAGNVGVGSTGIALDALLRLSPPSANGL